MTGSNLGQGLDNQIGTGGEQILGGVMADKPDSDTLHAPGPGRLHPRHGIFQNDALMRCCAQSLGGGQ